MVSVIVTCYNYGQYLRECLASVESQTYDHVQVIIVDDGSTDNTSEIAQSFIDDKPNWSYVHQPNSGQPAFPRNKGIESSQGELIVCIDADDIMTPTFVEECVQKFRMVPQASIVYTGVTCFGESNQQWNAPPPSYQTLIQRNFITCCSMYRREVWDDVGGYSTNVRGVEDYEFWIKAHGLGFQSINIPRQLWKYRVKSNGIFLADVAPNFEAKYRQIILNNPELYPPAMVRAAKSGRDVARLVG